MSSTREKILVLNLPGPILKSGSRWYNETKGGSASLKYYPYPWFMGTLTALLKKKGYEAVLKDTVAMEWTPAEVKNFVSEYKPTHIVCEPTWVSADDDARFLKSLDPKIIKIAVGNYATNYPEECFQKIKPDYVAVGEYEVSIVDFLSGDGALPKSFYCSKKKKYEMPELVEDLDDFPFPEREDTPWQYFNEPSCWGKNIVMTTSRGCRFRCSFCNVENIYGRHCYRVRSPKNIVDEMVQLKEKYDFDEIYFDDDNMVASKDHVDAVCREIIRRKVKVRFCCMGDARVDDETLGLLAKAGCVTYKFGLEHLDRAVLEAIPKGINPDRSLAIIKKCHKLGIRAYANLIVGLPKSTWDKDLLMLNRVFRTRPDLVQIGIATPYPGTPFYKKSVENNWLVADDIRKFDVTGASSVSYPDYPADKITEMFHLGWKLWYRHVLLTQPKTLWFFFTGEVRRNGLISTVGKAFSYGLKAISR